MRFSQIFLTTGYNTVVKLIRITEIKPTESGNTIDTEYIGAFKRFDPDTERNLVCPCLYVFRRR